MPKKGYRPLRKTRGADEAEKEYQLVLFITGATPNSMRALENVRQLCEQHLKGRHSLEIIDVYLHKALAKQYGLVAVPMLLKKTPFPQKKIVGDFSDEGKVLSILGITSPE